MKDRKFQFAAKFRDWYAGIKRNLEEGVTVVNKTQTHQLPQNVVDQTTSPKLPLNDSYSRNSPANSSLTSILRRSSAPGAPRNASTKRVTFAMDLQQNSSKKRVTFAPDVKGSTPEAQRYDARKHPSPKLLEWGESSLPANVARVKYRAVAAANTIVGGTEGPRNQAE